MEKIIIHRADTRGIAEHGWLKSFHTFSFAEYYNPERIHFGVLRVLNDDIVKPGSGFDDHAHDNMEIITIPLEGVLTHKDSLGHISIIKPGDIQVMSAGSGITHAEYNDDTIKAVNLLQIWIYPKLKNIEPTYQQKTFNPEDKINVFQEIITPSHENNGLHINQDAWLSIGKLDKGQETNYSIKKDNNGLYIFIIDGDINIEGLNLNSRDGIGITKVNNITIKAVSNCEILIMDIPMQISD
jgi:redox-sensitive bicupin YhaK (pirin superfamily)